MKKLILIIAITLSLASTAQVTHVSLQASGLTCSMCSNSINKALKTLDFILDVKANIKTYTFEITFKPNTNVDFDGIRKKVEGAGFAVSSFVATIQFDNVLATNNQPVTIGDMIFLINPAKEQTLNGPQKVKILNKGFVSPKESRMTATPVATPHTYNVSIS
jgi:copper chaperone CopZ